MPLAAGLQGQRWQCRQSSGGRAVPGHQQAGVLWPAGPKWGGQDHHHQGRHLFPVSMALFFNFALMPFH